MPEQDGRAVRRNGSWNCSATDTVKREETLKNRNMKKRVSSAIIFVYAALIVIFVLCYMMEWQSLRFTQALPVLFLSVMAFVAGRGRYFWMPLALLFSAAGDLMGSQSMFIPQVACFAAAHIAFIVYFLRNAWLRPGSLMACLLVAVVCTVLGFLIVPNIGNAAEKAFVIFYIVIICLMCMSAILWRKEKKACYITAAVLFMLSDMLIAFTRYGMVRIAYSSVIILGLYYGAQLMFALAYISRFMGRQRFNPAIRA